MLKYCAVLALLVTASFTLRAQQTAPSTQAAGTQGPGTLRAGAAKVDITPAPDAALPMSGYAGRTEGFKGIHDDLNVRALVIDDGTTQAALVVCEVIGI